MTRKLSNISFFSVLFPDLENVFFGKIHWAHPFRGRQGQEAILRLWRPNFGFHLFFMSFHLEFSLFWVSRLFDLSNLGNLKKKLHLWNQCLPMKMRYVTAFLSKFSTKSFHRGGVFVLACSHWTALDGYWTFCTIFCSKHI